MEKLETLQRESQERHSRKINPTCYLHVDKYIEKLEAVVEKKFNKKKRGRRKKTAPQKMWPDFSLRYHLRTLYDEGVKRIAQREKEKQERSAIPKIDISKLYVAAKKLEPKPEIKKWFKEPPVRPDEKKPFVRPPAEYSNKSPYGIASDLLLMK